MVPDSVKKVPRPTNTVVVDTGSKGARRYAVRCRSGYSLTVNNNPGPRNGEGMLFVAVQAIVLPLITILVHEMAKPLATLFREDSLRRILL